LVESFVVALSISSIASCSSTPAPREVCGNLKDDDGNGLADCADPDCFGKPECGPVDSGFFGTCAKCGNTCEKQADCLTIGFFNDVPLPSCETNRCTSLRQAVQVNVTLNAQSAWGTLISSTRSIATRFIKKRAADGSTVGCDTIEAAAPGRLVANAQQIEATGRFIYQGIDVRPVRMPSGSIPISFINVVTGDDYFIWMEMWGGAPDSATKFPTGNRLGFECFDGPAGGQSWPPIASTDSCSPFADAGLTGMCQQFDVTATRGPQP
jgi:hypothetical protein